MGAARDIRAILADRMVTVLALGEANAEEARARANLGGAEIGRRAVEGASADEITEAAADKSAAERRLARARARIAELDARLEALDLEVAAAEP